MTSKISDTELELISEEAVEKVSAEEKKQFDYSIKAVQELFEAAKKIDNSLK